MIPLTHNLVLVVVVDLGVPARACISVCPNPLQDDLSNLQHGLVTVAPEEVLGANVLISVLGTLL